MKFPQNQRHAGHAKRLSASLTALLSLTIGCASPGNPHPPSLNLPVFVTDLSAQRISDQVELHWTTPSRTTDGVDIKGNLTAELCRQSPQSTSASSCVPVQHLPVTPGPSHVTDPLPANLTTDPATLLAYRIQIFNAAGRAAGRSSPAFAAAGAAPPAIQQLHATPTRDGVIIEWQQQSTTSLVELDRILAGPPKPPAPSPAAKPQSPLHLTPSNPAEVHLKTPTNQPDAGGTTDPSAHKGETYTYTAQRVRTVGLGSHHLELRSPLSSPITLHLSDTFPPLAPTGLVAVPSGTGAAIDLSWQPNTEADLAGYHVYRQELTPSGQPLGPSQRLTQTPVTGPAFHDATALASHHYAYRVTAIDATGNESPPSAPILQTATEP